MHELTGKGVKYRKLPEYLLGQIEVDLQLLQGATGRNADEVAILVHIILHRIAHGPSPEGT